MARSNRPVLQKVQSVKKPIIPDQLVKPSYWTFSFRYFKQIKYFGFSHTSQDWFASLLERLKDLSKIDKDKFDRNYVLRQEYRYHTINWDHKNVPIRRSDLNWIDAEYLENEDEFPFYQFHVSQALGRIVGFWDSTSTIFHIVLLDPLHNIQPSKINDYKVDDCYPTKCQYSALLGHMDNMKKKNCDNDKCGYRDLVNSNAPHVYPERIVIAQLDENVFTEFSAILQKHSISKIIELGALQLMN